ncbi:MAG: EAL domain-containing protein, partial [Ilumatobacteraceae bacterium]
MQLELRSHALRQLHNTALPLLLVSTVMFAVLRAHIQSIALVVWYGLAVIDALLILLAERTGNHRRAAWAETDEAFVRGKLLQYTCFGLVWGSLPLVAARWGTDTGLWVALFVAFVVHGVAVLSGTPYRRLRLASLAALLLPIGISIVVRPAAGGAIAAVAVIYSVALVRLYDVLDHSVVEATQAKYEKTALAERLETYLNDRDPLTGLLNRRGLLNWLQRYATTATPPAEVAVGVLNIRRFSAMNELFGVGGGDDVLVELGRRLGQLPGPVLAVARLDGDEFAIVTPNTAAADRTRLLAMLGAVHRTPISVKGANIDLAMHVQHAIGPAADADNMLRAVRTELQRVRASGRAAPISLSGLDPVSHMEMVEQLRIGLADGSVGPWFQPIVDARSGIVTAFEALVRWAHPEKGLIAPIEFLPHAEVAGLAPKLTEIVMAASVRFVRDMMRQRRDHVPAVHVNVWPGDLRRSQFVDALRRQLATHGVPGRYIVL